MRTEYKILIEAAGRRAPEWFYCYALDHNDAEEQAREFRPGGWITYVECTGRAQPTDD